MIDNPTLQTRLEQNGVLYQTACNIFGGTPKVFRYYDEPNEISIDILTAKDSPQMGVSSYSTLGLCHKSGTESERFEIAAACKTGYEYFPELLSSCAFQVISGQVTLKLGTVVKNCIKTFIPQSALNHLLFIPPALWDPALPVLNLQNKRISWLFALPIYQSEYLFMKENGWEALLSEFALKNADPADLLRKPIL